MKKSSIIPLVMIVTLVVGFFLPRDSQGWVINPSKCIGCGKCAESCVRPESAVKAQIDYSKLENREFHPAMFKKTKPGSSTGIENRICPSDAIIRTQIDDSTWSYSIDEKLCIGCGKCSIRSRLKGTGAFTIDMGKDCNKCNECSIAVECPVGAISRVGESE